MASLDPRIEIIREKYGLDKADFWELPQKKGTWVAKHSALEVAAVKADIRFDMPTILEAHSAEGIAAVAVQGQMGDRFEWSIGECSPKNNKNAYPWAMAEKRAKDRVILKLIGIHGLVYSEDEMPDAEPRQAPAAPAAEPAPARTLVKDQRVIWGELRDEIDKCSTVEELGILWGSRLFQTEVKKLKESWVDLLVEHKDAHKVILTAPANGARVPPNFERIEQ